VFPERFRVVDNLPSVVVTRPRALLERRFGLQHLFLGHVSIVHQGLSHIELLLLDRP
jgi:hypothetical protein